MYTYNEGWNVEVWQQFGNGSAAMNVRHVNTKLVNWQICYGDFLPTTHIAHQLLHCYMTEKYYEGNQAMCEITTQNDIQLCATTTTQELNV